MTNVARVRKLSLGSTEKVGTILALCILLTILPDIMMDMNESQVRGKLEFKGEQCSPIARHRKPARHLNRKTSDHS